MEKIREDKLDNIKGGYLKFLNFPNGDVYHDPQLVPNFSNLPGKMGYAVYEDGTNEYMAGFVDNVMSESALQLAIMYSIDNGLSLIEYDE